MNTGLARTTLALAVALTVAAGPWPGEEASASCVAPYLDVEGARGEPRPAVAPGARVTVEGRAFVVGCDDVGTSTMWGCTVDEGEPVVPMEDIDLQVRQQGRVWTLGSADAGAAEENRLGHLSWTVRLPDGLRPGWASLVADEAQPLRVRIRGGRGGRARRSSGRHRCQGVAGRRRLRASRPCGPYG